MALNPSLAMTAEAAAHHDRTSAAATPVEATPTIDPGALIVAFLDAINPQELESLALARLEMGEGEAGPTRAILDVLKELAGG